MDEIIGPIGRQDRSVWSWKGPPRNMVVLAQHRSERPWKGPLSIWGTDNKEFQERCGQGVLGLRNLAGTSGAASWRGTAWPIREPRTVVRLTTILRPWRWRRYVPPKRRVQLYGLHGVISQKMILFKSTAVKNSNPTNLNRFTFSSVLCYPIVCSVQVPLNCRLTSTPKQRKNRNKR
jgi:hypothetical protein